jgi:hypothetical protein
MLKSASRMQKVVSRMETSKKEKTREKYREEFRKRTILELAGNLGLVPFYKDIRTATLRNLYRDVDKKGSSFTLTDAEKKKYMPDLYRREKEIERYEKSTEAYKLEQKMKKEEKKRRKEMLKNMFGR